VVQVDQTHVSGLPGTLGNAPFIARAPKIGAEWVVLYDETTIRPSPYAGKNWGVFAIGYNPLVSEQVAFILGTVSENKKFYLGAGSSFAVGAAVDGASLHVGSLTYGLGAWLFTHYKHYSRIAPGGGSVLATGSPDIDAQNLPHVRASTTGITIHGHSDNDHLMIGADNLASVNEISDSDLHGIPGLACDPTGQLLMLRYGAGLKGTSSDGGGIFNTLPNLPPGSEWHWAFAGGSDPNSTRWIAAHAALRYTDDFGLTWVNKEGNLTSLAPIPLIDMITVVTF
jgi:hypothetical protein